MSTCTEYAAGDRANGSVFSQVRKTEFRIWVSGCFVRQPVHGVGSGFFRCFNACLLCHRLDKVGATAPLDQLEQAVHRNFLGERFDATGDKATGQSFSCTCAIHLQFTGLLASGQSAHAAQGDCLACAWNEVNGQERSHLQHRKSGLGH